LEQPYESITTCYIPDNSSNKNDCGFIVINQDGLTSEAGITIASIKSINPDFPVTLVSSNKEDFKIAHISNNNLVDMINMGVQKSSKDWNFVVVSGRRLTSNFVRKFLYFCRENNDILYLSTRKKWSFADTPLECWFFNRNFTKPIQDQEGHFDLSKLIWVTEQKMNIKAVIGGLLR
jgi:hypothetical protein